MEQLKAAIINVETGETTFRDLTPEELAEHQKALDAQIALDSKKALLLEKLGLTADEFDLLLSNTVKVENAQMADEA
jgi:hypothetical protein